MNKTSNCIICGCALTGKQRSFCCINCKNSYYLSYDAQKKRAINRKSGLIAAHGGKCACCGYNFNLSALSFYNHNGDSLHIDANILANRSLSKLTKELEKAQVLCRNCYEELQNPPISAWPNNVSGEFPRDFSSSVEMTNHKFAHNLAAYGIESGQTIVLGVSGGVDSVVMLKLFAKLDLRTKIIVAHMNHGVRAEAALDERLVEGLAKFHGYKYVSKIIQKPISGNLEEELRNERRNFLVQVLEENKADFVALAHNANDQAETLLLNLVRGSGPAGLGAMEMKDGLIIRPLLNISRVEIETYARTNQLIWHEDKSNQDTSYNRNYIRHRLLPMLESLNPEYLGAISRTTYLQRQIDAYLKEEARNIIYPSNAIQHFERGSSRDTELPRTINTGELISLGKPILYEVLGLLYEKAKGDRKNLTLKHLEEVENLLLTTAGTKTLDLPGNITARRRYDRLDFYLKKVDNIPSAPSTKKLHLGTQKFGAWKITISPNSISTPAPAEGLDSSLRWNDKMVIDAETLNNLLVRTRKPGDFIAKKGLGGKKKLQDLYVDAKIDKVKRDSYPVVANSRTDEIIWVPFLAKSEYQPRVENSLYQITLEEVDHETIEV